MSSSPLICFLRRHLWFFILFTVCLLYAGWGLRRGWVAHDDGALAQSAERVLHGELPHRDFDEIYGGLLDYFHAAAFAIFGVRLISLRFVLYFFFIFWLPCFYAIALRFVPPLAAAGAMALAACWTIPLYSASMPSWYNLFFATFACLAVLHFLKSGRSWLLVTAGVLCGISVLIKITGLYACAAVFLTLVHHEQVVAQQGALRRWKVPGVYGWFVVLSLAMFVAAVLRVLAGHTGANYLFAFFVPCFLLALFLIARSGRAAALPNGVRFRHLFGNILIFSVGIALPVALFLLYYVMHGALPGLLEGVFVATMGRLTVTAFPPGSVSDSWPAVVLIALFLPALYLRPAISVIFAFLAMAGYLFVATAREGDIYSVVWDSVADLLPYLTAMVLAALIWREAKIAAGISSEIFALLAFAVCCNLVRYPFAGPIYSSYVLPLILLVVVAASRMTLVRSRGSVAIMMVFLVAFAIFRVLPGRTADTPIFFVRDQLRTPLGVERGREILVTEDVARNYQEIMKSIEGHSHSGVIYAGPDAPEMYFLAGKKNPTRVIFDFLDRSAESQAMDALRREPINVVVIRSVPQFSPPLSPALRNYVETHFPHVETVGGFEIHWAKD